MMYAFGEIVLVVIGILIALSINNWNERRISQINESLLVKNIIEDLRLDSSHFNKSLDELAIQLKVVDELIAKALDIEVPLDHEAGGYVRYSSDFRPISQRNHAEAVNNMENEYTRELLQGYFLKEDDVLDLFLEYEDIIHNKIRPYLSDVGMHNLASIYEEDNEIIQVLLVPTILEEQLKQVKFQQLLFERRLKTSSFDMLLKELKLANQNLLKSLAAIE